MGCGKKIIDECPVNRFLNIEALGVMCQIIWIPIEQLNELIVYDDCDHYFSLCAVESSCKSMLNEGMTLSVDKCPQCITVKKEERKVMGSIPYSLVEQVLDPE